MKKLIFGWMFITGQITLVSKHDDKNTYNLHVKGETIEYAYKEEIYEYIETKEFKYNEDLTFNK